MPLKRKMNEISRFSLNYVSVANSEISALNFEISPTKYAMKKCMFSARIHVEKFRILTKFFNNNEGRNFQTIVNKHKILSVFFS